MHQADVARPMGRWSCVLNTPERTRWMFATRSGASAGALSTRRTVVLLAAKRIFCAKHAKPTMVCLVSRSRSHGQDGAGRGPKGKTLKSGGGLLRRPMKELPRVLGTPEDKLVKHCCLRNPSTLYDNSIPPPVAPSPSCSLCAADANDPLG